MQRFVDVVVGLSRLLRPLGGVAGLAADPGAVGPVEIVLATVLAAAAAAAAVGLVVGVVADAAAGRAAEPEEVAGGRDSVWAAIVG